MVKSILSLALIGAFSLLSADGYYNPSTTLNSSANVQGYLHDNPQNSAMPNTQGYMQRDNRSNYQNAPVDRTYQDTDNQDRYMNNPHANPQGYYHQGSGNLSDNVYTHPAATASDRSLDQVSGNAKSVSDNEILNRIRKKIGSGWFSNEFEKVSYDVNNGNVLLRGTVNSLDEKDKAEQNVKKIEGVKSVTNEITVTGKKAYSNW